MLCHVGNKLEHLEDILHLETCRSLVTLDLSSNRMRDEDAVRLVMNLPLSLLKMNGNPVVSSMRYAQLPHAIGLPSRPHIFCFLIGPLCYIFDSATALHF